MWKFLLKAAKVINTELQRNLLNQLAGCKSQPTPDFFFSLHTVSNTLKLYYFCYLCFEDKA